MDVGKYGGKNCYFHPKEVVIGVCHLCLNERLLILSTQQGVKSSKSTKYDYYTSNKRCYNININRSINNNSSYYYHNHHKPKPYITLPKLFPIASFFNTRDNFRHRIRRHLHRHQDFFDDVDATSTSFKDESFISIKFGNNGVALRDKTSNKVSLEHCSLSWGGQTTVKDTNKTKDNGNNSGNKNVLKQANPRVSMLLRWRMRIGQILHVSRLKKTCKANA